MPFHVMKNAEREVFLEWQRQLSHLKKLKALLKIGEKLSVRDAGMVCLYVQSVLRMYSLHVMKHPDLALRGRVGLRVCGGNHRFTQAVRIRSWPVWAALCRFS